MSRAHDFDSRGHCNACGMRNEEGWPGRYNPCPLGSLTNKVEQTRKRRAKAKEGGVLTMTYPDGTKAEIKVPASEMCRHKEIRMLCKECKKAKAKAGGR